MPLFFFLSGYVFSSRFSLFKLSYRRFNNLILPYFLYGLIYYPFWILRRFYGQTPNLELDVFYPIFRIITFKLFWFLPALFLVIILFFTVHKWITFKTLIPFSCAMTLIHYILTSYAKDILHESIIASFIGVIYYSAGYVVRQKGFRINRLFAVFLIPVNALIFYFGFQHFGIESILHIDNHFYYYAASTSAIFIVLALADTIPRNKVFHFLGGNTILIYLLHGYPPSVYRRLFALIGCDFCLSPTVIWAIIYSLSDIVLLAPFIVIINRWFPGTIGKQVSLGTDDIKKTKSSFATASF